MDFQQIRKYVKGVLTNSFLNKTTLDKLSTSDEGNLLFDGKEINSGSSGCSNMVDFDNVITTISAAKRIEYTAQENCYLYKQTVATGSNGNEKITINGNIIGWTIYTSGTTIGGYVLIPLKKDDTIIVENVSDLSFTWQPITIYGVVKENILHEYSTEEKVVGKWIDGKPIYEITIDLGEWTVNSSLNYDATHLNIDEVIFIDAFWHQINQPNYRGTISTTSGIDNRCLYFNGTYIKGASSYFTHRYITIQYTKTTD